ncbi:cytochrome P450 [Kineococcus sp. R8]|nr:cytochrome P450 [Kineococcus siccus]
MDPSIDLVRQGYPWAARVRDGRLAAPLRFLGRRSAVVGGPEGVRRFYDDRLRRRGAFPPPVKLVLFGAGAVHGLDDAEHHHRKALFVRALSPAAVRQLGERAEREWALATRDWTAGRPHDVVLFDEAVQVLTRAVTGWAGVPCGPAELSRRARQLATVVDGFGRPGPAWVRAALARAQLDRWAAGVVRGTRRGDVHPPAGSVLQLTADATDLRGRPLPDRVAAVELLNVLRPTVAVAWFVAAAGRALAEHPGWRERIADGDAGALAAFCHEVRRVHPFVPVLAARARTAQDVEGVRVPRGGFVVLDVHGTTHDPRHWPDPDRFDPGRFLDATPDPDTLVPQGGGDVATGHRCPGEGVTLTVLAVAVRALARLPFSLPPQDLGCDDSVMPTRPRSGVVIRPRRALD